MFSPRLIRTLLIGLIAIALTYFVAERWPSRPTRSPVQEFCSSVVANQPVQQVLARAAGLRLSTMMSDTVIRVYSVAAKSHYECHVKHQRGLVTGQRLLPTGEAHSSP